MQRIKVRGWKTGYGQVSGGKLPFGALFLAGILLGIFVMNLGKNVILENSSLLNEETLYRVKYMTVDNHALFRYVLRKRLALVLILGVLATTYLGIPVCMATAFWYGMSSGAFLAVLTARYGLKGVLFALAGIFPQYLLYVPAMAILLTWCVDINRSIYFKGYREKENIRYLLPTRIVRYFLVIVIVILGCMVEAFCNPGILMAFLKVF